MMFGQKFKNHGIFKRQVNALIRLRACAGWSEPLLVAHNILLEISCHGSNVLTGVQIASHMLFQQFNMTFYLNTWLKTRGGGAILDYFDFST